MAVRMRKVWAIPQPLFGGFSRHEDTAKSLVKVYSFLMLLNLAVLLLDFLKVVRSRFRFVFAPGLEASSTPRLPSLTCGQVYVVVPFYSWFNFDFFSSIFIFIY